MDSVEIFIEDIRPEKQAEILEASNCECIGDFNNTPIAVLDFE